MINLSEKNPTMKRIPISELGLKTDQEAINFVTKLKTTGSSIYYLTNGEERVIIGKFEDIPIFESAVKERLSLLENKVSKLIEEVAGVAKLEEKITQITNELRQRRVEKTEEKEEAIIFPKLPEPLVVPPPVVPIEPDIKPENKLKKQGLFTFIRRGEKSKAEEIKPEMKKHTFKCPNSNCRNEFSVEVEEGKKIIELKCPKCGELVFTKRFGIKKIVAIIGGAVAAIAFFYWLFFS